MKIHPDDPFDFHLDPEGAEDRRTLVYKCGTARHWMQFASDYKAAMDSEDDDYLAKIFAMAERNLIGWKNIGCEFNGKPRASARQRDQRDG